MKALTKYSKDINLQYIHFLKLFWRGIFGIFPMIFAYISYLLLNLFGGFTFFLLSIILGPIKLLTSPYSHCQKPRYFPKKYDLFSL